MPEFITLTQELWHSLKPTWDDAHAAVPQT